MVFWEEPTLSVLRVREAGLEFGGPSRDLLLRLARRLLNWRRRLGRKSTDGRRLYWFYGRNVTEVKNDTMAVLFMMWKSTCLDDLGNGLRMYALGP